ncbi:MAG TPA: hypothetical protein VF950_30685 [Planctomycetota bacterium]
MRKSALGLLLLAACGRAEDAGRVQDLLSRTPIPLDRLRDALEIKPGELEILGGDPPALYDPSAPPLWAVMNRGMRPLWLHRDDLTVFPDVDPLVRAREPLRCGFMMSPGASRPAFVASDWILLLPLEQKALRVPDPGGWGRVKWSVHIGGFGRRLYREADSFNAKKAKDFPDDWKNPLDKDLGESTHLPPFTWDGGAANLDLDLRAVGDGRVALDAKAADREERPVALALRAWVLSDDRRLLYEGRLESVSHQGVGGKISTRYVVPATLPPGTHRLLAMGQYAGEYLSPGRDARRGVSRWIPLEIK